MLFIFIVFIYLYNCHVNILYIVYKIHVILGVNMETKLMGVGNYTPTLKMIEEKNQIHLFQLLVLFSCFVIEKDEL